MLTQNQLRAQVYNALINDAQLTAIISDRLYWLDRPTIVEEFPMVIYKIIDTIGDYSFGGTGINVQSEEFTIQLDVYTSSSDITGMDNIIERIKAVMTGLCFRLISGTNEFPADSTLSPVLQNKVVRPLRWEYINV